MYMFISSLGACLGSSEPLEYSEYLVRANENFKNYKKKAYASLSDYPDESTRNVVYDLLNKLSSIADNLQKPPEDFTVDNPVDEIALVEKFQGHITQVKNLMKTHHLRIELPVRKFWDSIDMLAKMLGGLLGYSNAEGPSLFNRIVMQLKSMTDLMDIAGDTVENCQKWFDHYTQRKTALAGSKGLYEPYHVDHCLSDAAVRLEAVKKYFGHLETDEEPSAGQALAGGGTGAAAD